MKKFLLIICALFEVFAFSGCKIQITPSQFPNTKWTSEKPNMYFEVFEEEMPEGRFVFNDKSTRIYVAWTPGSQCVTFFDADKQDANEYYSDEIVLLDGVGHWENRKREQYIIEICTDNIGLNTTEIVFSKA